MPVLTAEPKHLEHFTYTTCSEIDRLNLDLQRVKAERDQARAWAAAWKRAAKNNRFRRRAWMALAKLEGENADE